MSSTYLLTVIGLVIFVFGTAVPGRAQINDQSSKKAPLLYRIQPGDKLSIKFFSNPELNEISMIVRPDGFINPQLINEIKAVGRTVAELKSDLERQYNEILLTPMITVSIVEFVAARIFVGGQVNKPGRYDLREAKTLVEAIFVAGSFTRDAHRSMVMHARPDGKGDWVITRANFMDLVGNKGTEKDLPLNDGDFIFVPDSKMSQFNKAVESLRGLLPRYL